MVGSRVLGCAASYGAVQWVGLGMGKAFVCSLYQRPNNVSKLLFAGTKASQAALHPLMDNAWGCFQAADVLMYLLQGIESILHEIVALRG